MGTQRGEYILMWFKNLFKKRKHYDVLDLEKVKADYGPPQFTVYEHMNL